MIQVHTVLLQPSFTVRDMPGAKPLNVSFVSAKERTTLENSPGSGGDQACTLRPRLILLLLQSQKLLLRYFPSSYSMTYQRVSSSDFLFVMTSEWLVGLGVNKDSMEALHDRLYVLSVKNTSMCKKGCWIYIKGGTIFIWSVYDSQTCPGRTV